MKSEARWRIILGWIFTPPFLIAVLVTMCVWQPLIAVSRRVHPRLHQRVIEFGNFLLQVCLWIIGSRVRTITSRSLPPTGPVIVVSNHQSLLDIPILIWAFRRYYAKFIAKAALGRGIPSASYVLRTGGHALIERENARQAMPEIKRFADFVRDNHYAAVIFPEGTRARDGRMKHFKSGGLITLLEEIPSAPVIPVIITNAWRLVRYNFFPVPFGITVTYRMLDPLPRTPNDCAAIAKQVENVLRSHAEALTDQRVHCVGK